MLQQNQQKSLEERQEAERKAIEAAAAQCRKMLEAMRDGGPETCERIGKQLKDFIVQDKHLPVDFKGQVRERMRAYECQANMRACDAALHKAMRYAAEDLGKERMAALNDARRFLGKARSMGAEADFVRAAEREIETILLTGGVHHKGPTRAKPLDTAPKPPNRAKC